MTAQLIDGNALAAQIRAEVAGRTAALKARGIQPHLAIILVGDNPASQVYVKSKAADSEQTGLKATLERYPASLPESALLERIAGVPYTHEHLKRALAGLSTQEMFAGSTEEDLLALLSPGN